MDSVECSGRADAGAVVPAIGLPVSFRLSLFAAHCGRHSRPCVVCEISRQCAHMLQDGPHRRQQIRKAAAALSASPNSLIRREAV